MQASTLASKEVIRIARKILKADPSLTEFIMGMGRWMFSDKDGVIYDADQSRFAELCDFIDEWDNTIHITGEPMRFTATGPIIRDW